jgi:colanic acid/amylovoran biosynthesis glycosyltransferase
MTNADANTFRLCQVHLTRDDPGQSFARAHADRLPCRVCVVHGDWSRPLFLDHAPMRSTHPVSEFGRLARRALAYWVGRNGDQDEITSTYIRAFRRARCDAVLVEFGNIAVQTLDACRRLRLPLVVHFHGFDVHSRSLLERYGTRYDELFSQAKALVVVSRTMENALLALGAPAAKTHYVPNGVDAADFTGGSPADAPPTFLSVGRFVEKKAPQLTIAAFRPVRQRHPDARLRMIGDGRLLGACRDLARGLGLADAVDFLGTQPNEVVAEEMRRARAFVQHSVVAADGDSEGMPVSILEASATGLPVVSTRHAGIPEIVAEGETGFLVEEHDVDGMTLHMNQLAADPCLAAALGTNAKRRVIEQFSIDASIAQLWCVIQSANERRDQLKPILDTDR